MSEWHMLLWDRRYNSFTSKYHCSKYHCSNRNEDYRTSQEYELNRHCGSVNFYVYEKPASKLSSLTLARRSLRVSEANKVSISSQIWVTRQHSNSPKTFTKIGKKLNTFFYNHFRTSWIIWDDEPIRPGPTVALFDGLFIGKYKR